MNKLILLLAFVLMILPMVSAEQTLLDHKGWNHVGIQIYGQNDNSTDRNITLLNGYNLIGMSSYINFSHSNLKLTYDNGTSLTWDEATNRFLVNYNLQYLGVKSDGSQGYIPIPIADNQLRKRVAYWVFLNSSVSMNLTLTGIGGTYINKNIQFMNLTFSNGTAVLNVTQAFTEGWIGVPGQGISSLIRYYDTDPDFGGWRTLLTSANLSSWQGYALWSNYANITMCVGDPSCNVTSSTPVVNNGNGKKGNEYGYGKNGDNFGYNNPNLPKVEATTEVNNSFGYGSTTDSKFGYNNPLLPKLSSTYLYMIKYTK